MKQGQFSPEQILAILHEAQVGDKSITEVCCQHNLTQATFYRWRKKYGGMSVPEAQRLKELEKENARLKRLLAERDLAIDALQEYLAKKQPHAHSNRRREPFSDTKDCPSVLPVVCCRSTAQPFSINRVPTKTRPCANSCRISRRRSGGAEPSKPTTGCLEKASGSAKTGTPALEAGAASGPQTHGQEA
ncbi:MAG TPA: transposase [Chthonomonadaceae bacterium]|nr:transposase [Chthonomonadaceae bacterium]